MYKGSKIHTTAELVCFFVFIKISPIRLKKGEGKERKHEVRRKYKLAIQILF